MKLDPPSSIQHRFDLQFHFILHSHLISLFHHDWYSTDSSNRLSLPTFIHTFTKSMEIPRIREYTKRIKYSIESWLDWRENRMVKWMIEYPEGGCVGLHCELSVLIHDTTNKNIAIPQILPEHWWKENHIPRDIN